MNYGYAPGPKPYVASALMERHIERLKDNLKHAEQCRDQARNEYERCVSEVTLFKEHLNQAYREQKLVDAQSNNK